MRKKVLAVFLIILLSLSMLSACTGEEAAISADETTEAVTTQAMPATLAPTAAPETTPSETKPTETTPSETTPPETVPSETEPPVPVDPDTLMFTEEEYPKVDGSTSTKPLAKSIQEEFTGAENVEIKHSKSHQSYLNVIDGLCDMILAVEPSPDEYAYAAEKGVMLDGYPRTVAQAESLTGILKETGLQMGGAVLIDAPREILMKRLTGRRLCTNKECGAIYNINDVAPKVENVCDKCGSPLYQRSDDSEATVLGRLKVYDEQTFPLIDYYTKRNELITVAIEDAPIEHNFAHLCQVMGI